jgi:hypothetical protein
MQTRVHTHNGFLTSPPERPGTPMRAPDTIDWLAETVIPQPQAARLTLPEPTATQCRRANAQLAILGLCVGTAMGVWIGLIPAATLGSSAHSLAHGVLSAYGITAVALAGVVNVPYPANPDLANGRVGDLAVATGLAAGITFELARYGLLR